jgi:hypothetical protein
MNDGFEAAADAGTVGGSFVVMSDTGVTQPPSLPDDAKRIGNSQSTDALPQDQNENGRCADHAQFGIGATHNAEAVSVRGACLEMM